MAYDFCLYEPPLPCWMMYCCLHQWGSIYHVVKVRIKSDSQWDQGFRSHVALDVFKAHTCVLREGRTALDDVRGCLTGMFPEVMLVKIKYNKLCFQLFTSTHSRLRLGLVDVPCRRNKGKRRPWTYKVTVSHGMCCSCVVHLKSPNKVPGRATF